jgi:hypothetical protein
MERKNWRELANAALEAKDPDKLLEIVQELNKVLKHEEQVRDFRGLREPFFDNQSACLTGSARYQNWHLELLTKKRKVFSLLFPLDNGHVPGA